MNQQNRLFHWKQNNAIQLQVEMVSNFNQYIKIMKPPESMQKSLTVELNDKKTIKYRSDCNVRTANLSDKMILFYRSKRDQDQLEIISDYGSMTT